ncbi:MAG: hypothetical protein GXO59_03250 [Dictyoglomi bacterium]|nr:hypothetical protein [Dictyoglomota bacterium]
MEDWLSVREATSQVSKTLQKAKSTDEIEALLVELIPKFVDVDGVAAIRHIKHIGKTFMSHTYGIYEQFKHNYTDDDMGLTGYIIKYKVPLFINRKSDIPKGVKEVGTYEEGEHYAVIPLLDSSGEVMLVIMTVKVGRPFTPKEITTLRSMVIQAGIIYERIYLKARMEKFRKSSTLIADFASYHTDNPPDNIVNLAKETLHLCKDTIKGAEYGSLLMLTEDGFRFIGVMGYSEELLKKPPIPYEHQLRWYGFGENRWKQGIPRILGHEEILKRDNVNYDVEVGKAIERAQSTLGIPIIVGGKVKYFLNIDNFTTPAAFDDVDIDIAMLIGNIFASSAEIGKHYQEILTHVELIKTLSAPHFDSPSATTDMRNIIDIFIKSLIDNMKVLGPSHIFAIHYPMQSDWVQIYPEEDDIEMFNLIKKIDTSPTENSIYISPKHLYVTWFTRSLTHGYIKILVTKKDFLPHGDWWTTALQLILDYFVSFVKIVTQARNMRYMARSVAFHVGKLLEDINLEPRGHMEFMKKVSPIIAKQTWGDIPEDFIYGLYLHDIGKIMLTGKERQNSGIDTNKHVVLGSQLIEATGLDYLLHLSNIVKYHHEKALGGGPFGLKGSDIPREAEIVGMLCHFHHLLSKGLSLEEALRVIHSHSPSHYSMFAVDNLKLILEVYKDGH